MFDLKTIAAGVASTAVGLAMCAQAAMAETTIRVQSVIPATADEIVMLKDFANDVRELTDGEVNIEVLPAGSVVGVQETLDAVDAGLIEGGFAWTHYWSGKHPAAMLFGSPVAGGGVGMDNIAFMSWFLSAGGKELYEQLWDEMDMNVVGFMLQPVGPEALGWFKEPIESMADFRKYRFRTPPGIPGQTYKDIGVASVAMGGGDILPALEKGTIDAAEWCCPKPDSVFGFQKVLKHYYLQGLHQVVVNADLYLNKDVFNGLTPLQQKAIEVAANASLMKSMAYRIHENGKALDKLVNEDGVILHDTPADYFTEYMNAANKALEKNAEENEFFAKVWQSQKDFAKTAVPFWAGAQTSNANLGRAYADQLKNE
ncbi:TRAP transporter substrate-binding protein [Litoreibacter roseus]|uniref:Exported solute-binding protein n=1 Tax=Litoreibacter roseus TaxID=2601869 RepID=A0A6N6JFY1_9RHOB|nr:TRAP transporter substrate-binding protein [Litoreibacter roseus]GFE64198.1 exported solute-binding protein [Litoreibacter roseus]